MKLEVPYYSQYKEVLKDDWKNRACTMTTLKMAMDFIDKGRGPSIDKLMEEALTHSDLMLQKGLITKEGLSHGFPHDVVVAMAHNYGFPAYREEFKSYALDQDRKSKPSEYTEKILNIGIQRLKQALDDRKLPIVSVLPGLSEGKSFHTIILIGYELEGEKIKGFYYHDPDSNGEDRKDLLISLSDFLNFWKRLVIFVG